MPRLTVRLVRTALGHLVLGALLGGLLMAGRALELPALLVRLQPVHAEILLIGWLGQFTLGTAFWILPKHATGPPRGSEAPVELAWFCLNGGVLLAALGPALAAPAWIATAGRLAEATAFATFAHNAWPRVKAFGVGRSLGG